jgi:NADPH-dependent ferric siderophore reductase
MIALDTGTTDATSSPPGVLPRLLVRWFFRPANVAENLPLGMGMHRITLEGEALRNTRWTPGDKIQIQMGQALVTRTYTPVNWDATAGRTWFIAHAHAAGPGSKWVRNAYEGQACQVMGPRSSLNPSKAPSADWLLLGDETAIGLAMACKTRHSFLEAGNAHETQSLCQTLGFPASTYQRQPNETHLGALFEDALAHAHGESRFLLAGRARSVQWLVKALRRHGVDPTRMLTKAYWADGKAGLD